MALTTIAGGSVWLAAPRASRACSCLPPKPPIVAASEAHAVFEGRPGRPIPTGNEVRYTFHVTRVFRGRVPPIVEVYTPAHSAMCGRRFEANSEYLVYASVRNGDDRFRDNLCSRTRPAEKAADDYLALGGSRAPTTKKDAVEPSELVGEITREPPRIEPRPEPPPQPPASTGRGCVVGEKPHGGSTPSLVALGLLGIANRRRQVLG